MSKYLTDLRNFLEEYCDIILPAICLISCIFAICMAGKRTIRIKNNAGTITIIKDNRSGNFESAN